jgi:hypothetical protein
VVGHSVIGTVHVAIADHEGPRHCAPMYTPKPASGRTLTVRPLAH